MQIDQSKILGVIWSTAAKELCPQKTPTVTRLEILNISKRRGVLCGQGSRRPNVHHRHSSKQIGICFYLRPPYTVEKMQNELCMKKES